MSASVRKTRDSRYGYKKGKDGSQQSLSRWQKELRETGDIESRGSGNYASDEAKEIVRLRRKHFRAYRGAIYETDGHQGSMGKTMDNYHKRF